MCVEWIAAVPGPEPRGGMRALAVVARQLQRALHPRLQRRGHHHHPAQGDFCCPCLNHSCPLSEGAAILKLLYRDAVAHALVTPSGAAVSC